MQAQEADPPTATAVQPFLLSINVIERFGGITQFSPQNPLEQLKNGLIMTLHDLKLSPIPIV